jgi:flagellar motor switch protein FliN/FliY
MTTSNPRPAKLQELQPAKEEGPALFPPKIDLIQGVRVRLGAMVGHAEITVAELFALKEGSLLKLDRATDEPLEIYLDGKLVAEGELVVVDDQFGVRLTRIGDAGLG